MATVGGLVVEISANIAKLVSGVEQSRTVLKSLQGDVGKITGAFTTMGKAIQMAFYSAPILAVATALKKTANAGEEFYAISKKIGISVESLSALKYAAEQSETSMEDLTIGLGILARHLHESGKESQQSTEALKALKIQIKDTQGNIRPMHDILLDLADRFSKIEEGAGKTALAMELFGRSGKNMLPLLSEGKGAILELEKEAERMGIVFTESSAKAADAFNDNIRRFKSTLMGFIYLISNEAIPILNDFFEIFSVKGRATADLARIEANIEVLEKAIANPNILQRMFSNMEKMNTRLKELQTERDKILKEYFTHTYSKEEGNLGIFDKKKSAPWLPDAEAIKKAFHELINNIKSGFKTYEDILKINEDTLSEYVEISKDIWETDAEITKTYTDVERNILERHYEQTITSTENYYSKLRDFALDNYKTEVLLIEQSTQAEKAAIELKINDQISLYEKLSEAIKTIQSKKSGYTTEAASDAIRWAKEQQATITVEINKLKLSLQGIDEVIINKITKLGVTLYKSIMGLNLDEPIAKIKEYYETLNKELSLTEENLNIQKNIADKLYDINKIREIENELEKVGIERKQAINVQRIAEIKILDLLTPALEKELNVREQLNKLYEQTKILIPANTFSSGIEQGIKEYLSTLKWGFDKGKTMALEFANKIEDTLVNMFDDPKKAIKDLFDYFMKMLERMVAQAIMKEIIIPIFFKTDATGNITGFSSGLDSTTGSGYAVGGYIGAAYSAYNMYQQSQEGTLTPASGAMMGAQVGSMFGPIGMVVGAIIGTIVSLLTQHDPDFGEMALGSLHLQDTITPALNTPGFSTQDEWRSYTSAGGFVSRMNLTDEGWPMTDEALKQIAEAFEDVSNAVEDVMKDVGLDISGFAAGFYKQIDLEGLDAEAATAKMKEWMADYIEFASGIDFSQWQKSGEDIITTIDRILTAMSAFPETLESIGRVIDTISQDKDVAAQFKDDLAAAISNIQELNKALIEATDPSDAITYANSIKEAVWNAFNAAVTAINNLVNAIAALKTEALNFAITMQGKIDALTGGSAATGIMWGRMVDIYNQINAGIGTPAESFTALQALIGLLDQWVATNIAAIEDFYKIQKEAIQSQIDNINTQIDTLSEQKSAIDDQISAIQDEINLTQKWKSVLESVEKQILDMKTSLSSPRDIFERMDVMKSEMERVRGLYTGATGEEKAGYASQLQSLISEYLGMAQEAYQRPSPEYQAIYSEMLGWLEGIKTDAESYGVNEIDLLAQIADLQNQQTAIDMQIKEYQAQIKDLNAEMIALDNQMATDIQAFKDEAAEYYQWAMTEGAKLYEDKISELEQTLQDIIGDKTVGEYIQDLRDRAVLELQNIQDLLASIFANLFPGMEIPAYQTGGIITHTGLALVHAGEKVIPAGQKYSNITIAPNITVYTEGDVNGKDLAEMIEDILIKSLKDGKGRKQIQRLKVYA